VNGSLLLARSGQNTLVYRKENLRSALGQLPTGVMLLDKEQNRRLYNMGIRKIRDIWRLPPDELRKRFGSDFVNLLNKALGITHEPTHNYVPPPAFTTSYDLPYEIENLNRLLPIVDEMLIQLCEFLKNRDLNTDHLKLFLLHENRNHTDLDLNLRQASRCRKHLLLLIETHFGNLNIPAPVIGLKISVKKFDAFIGESDQLLIGNLIVDKSNSNSANNTLNHLIEQLQARLGFDSLKSISAIAEHGPEYAVRQLNYKESRILTSITPVVTNRRPFWLLENPIQLTLRNGQLYHDQFIILISGPERVETYWWSSQEIQRNYYIARKVSGSRLWIFRECKGKRNWYLHGYFA
jgi:protein ImuB